MGPPMTDLKNVSAEEWKETVAALRRNRGIWACAPLVPTDAPHIAAYDVAIEYAERMEKEAKGREACKRGEHDFIEDGRGVNWYGNHYRNDLCRRCNYRVNVVLPGPDPKPTRADVDSVLRAYALADDVADGLPLGPKARAIFRALILDARKRGVLE